MNVFGEGKMLVTNSIKHLCGISIYIYLYINRYIYRYTVDLSIYIYIIMSV